MKDEIAKLKQIVKEQEKQILSLRKAMQQLMGMLKDTDKRARRNSESLRRVTNDINTIKTKLRS